MRFLVTHVLLPIGLAHACFSGPVLGNTSSAFHVEHVFHATRAHFTDTQLGAHGAPEEYVHASTLHYLEELRARALKGAASKSGADAYLVAVLRHMQETLLGGFALLYGSDGSSAERTSAIYYYAGHEDALNLLMGLMYRQGVEAVGECPCNATALKGVVYEYFVSHASALLHLLLAPSVDASDTRAGVAAHFTAARFERMWRYYEERTNSTPLHYCRPAGPAAPANSPSVFSSRVAARRDGVALEAPSSAEVRRAFSDMHSHYSCVDSPSADKTDGTRVAGYIRFNFTTAPSPEPIRDRYVGVFVSSAAKSAAFYYAYFNEWFYVGAQFRRPHSSSPTTAGLVFSSVTRESRVDEDHGTDHCREAARPSAPTMGVCTVEYSAIQPDRMYLIHMSVQVDAALNRSTVTTSWLDASEGTRVVIGSLHFPGADGDMWTHGSGFVDTYDNNVGTTSCCHIPRVSVLVTCPFGVDADCGFEDAIESHYQCRSVYSDFRVREEKLHIRIEAQEVAVPALYLQRGWV